MKKIYFAALAASVLCLSCGNGSDSGYRASSVKIGGTFTDKQISVRIDEVELLKGKFLAIKISVANNRTEAVDYSSIFQ
jgi:hypothetical protein